MTARRLPALLLALLLGLPALTACSGDTRLTLDLDLLSVIDQADRTGTFPAALDRAELPADDGAALDELGLSADLADAVERLALALEVGFEAPDAAAPIELSVDVHLAPAGQDLYASAPVASGTATVGPAGPADLTLDVTASETENPVLLDTVRGGDAHVGVVLRRGADGDAAAEVAYRLARFDLRITTSASGLDVF
jgi:hypothetical protein